MRLRCCCCCAPPPLGKVNGEYEMMLLLLANDEFEMLLLVNGEVEMLLLSAASSRQGQW